MRIRIGSGEGVPCEDSGATALVITADRAAPLTAAILAAPVVLSLRWSRGRVQQEAQRSLTAVWSLGIEAIAVCWYATGGLAPHLARSSLDGLFLP